MATADFRAAAVSNTAVAEAISPDCSRSAVAPTVPSNHLPPSAQ